MEVNGGFGVVDGANWRVKGVMKLKIFRTVVTMKLVGHERGLAPRAKFVCDWRTLWLEPSR
jgi:hypothetical protein